MVQLLGDKCDKKGLIPWIFHGLFHVQVGSDGGNS